jgi:nucleotide-binding universal stress UspA family protein
VLLSRSTGQITDIHKIGHSKSRAAGKPDLIAIGALARSNFNPTLSGGFTKEVICTPPCDALVVHR